MFLPQNDNFAGKFCLKTGMHYDMNFYFIAAS